MRRSIKDSAIILASKTYSEADKIFVLYTATHGRISVIAKGVRRLSSRKRGSMEVFNKIDFEAIKTRGMPIITEVETIDSFEQIRKSLKKISVAYYFVELVGKTTRDEEVNEEIYDLLGEYLKKLKTETGLKPLRIEFAVKLLETLGFWPKDKPLSDPDKVIQDVIEKNIFTLKVGKRLQI